MSSLTPGQCRLLNRYQHGFPLVSRPFREMAETCGLDERETIEQMRDWLDSGVLSRIGAVVEHGIGASTLAALAVPAERLDEVATIVSGFPEVNHNYLREHRFNLWFVVAAPSRARVEAVMGEIAERTGLSVLDLPMEARYCLDTGFEL